MHSAQIVPPQVFPLSKSGRSNESEAREVFFMRQTIHNELIAELVSQGYQQSGFRQEIKKILQDHHRGVLTDETIEESPEERAKLFAEFVAEDIGYVTFRPDAWKRHEGDDVPELEIVEVICSHGIKANKASDIFWLDDSEFVSISVTVIDRAGNRLAHRVPGEAFFELWRRYDELKNVKDATPWLIRYAAQVAA
jgi:hypothetical protein